MNTTVRRLLVAVVAATLAALCLAAPAQAVAGATLKGTVTDRAGKPLGGIHVKLVRTTGGNTDRVTERTVTTASNGTYQATGLTTVGDDDFYVVEARDPQGRYVADSVTAEEVYEGRTITIDFSLDAAARLTGTVARPSGSLSKVRVFALSVDGSTSGSARVLADGRYALAGLSAGEYELTFLDDSGEFLPQCYHEVVADLSSAEPQCDAQSVPSRTTVTITAGQTTTVEKETLKFKAATLAGKITDASGNPIKVSSGDVLARQKGADDFTAQSTAGSSTGAYTVGGLAAGAWTLRAALDPSIWENRYLGNTTSLSTARFIDLSYGEKATANITLRTMPKITYTASSPQKGYAAFSVKVLKANNGQPAWGDVTIAIGGQTKKATLKDGKAGFRFKGLTKGANAFKISNLGNKYTANGGKRASVTVK
ncbi:MAG: carboxypeptidase-like regulatory domain-containing protein [Aeromicrobium erythreum]